MNYKILVVTMLFIGFTVSTKAQKTIGSVEQFVEQRAKEQRAAEKADPALSKTRSGRILTKEEKVAIQKSRKAERQKMVKAMKSMDGKKMKVKTSKNQPSRPRKGTSKKIKTKEK